MEKKILFEENGKKIHDFHYGFREPRTEPKVKMSRDFLPVLELYGNGLDWGRNKINLLVFHLIVFPWGRARLVTPGRHNVQDMRWNSRTTPTSTFKYRNKDRNRYKYRKNTDFADRSREAQCTRHGMEF